MPNSYDLGLNCGVSSRSSVSFNGMLRTLTALVIVTFCIFLLPKAVQAEENTANNPRKTINKETPSQEGSQDYSSGLQTRITGLESANEHIDKSVKDLQLQVEETAVQLYDSRAKDMEHFKKLEETISQINQYLADMGKLSASKQQAAGAHGASKDTYAPVSTDTSFQDEKNASPSVETAEYTPSGGNNLKELTPAMTSYAAPLEAMLAAVLVFLAPLGFSFLEASRANHSMLPRIFLRNLLVTAIMLMTFATAGSWISYGQSLLVSINSSGTELAPNGESNDTFWLFHLQLTIMVGLVANTILSDRVSLYGHVVMALLLGLILHPLIGRLVWMGDWLPSNPGWLEALGFVDFAGATAIHSAGAWFALAWLWCFPAARSQSDGNPVHSLLALFILWLNWFGLAMGYQHHDVQLMALPLINVSLAGATAVLLSFLMSMKQLRASNQADAPLIYFRLATGVLGGLVAISAGIDRFTPIEAIVVGGLAGVLHHFAYHWLNAMFLKQDHTAAALIATHGVCGVWGTLCLGFMGSAGSFAAPEVKQLGIQSLGIVMTLLLGSMAGLLGALPYQLLSRSKTASVVPSYENTGNGTSLAQELSSSSASPVVTTAPAEPENITPPEPAGDSVPATSETPPVVETSPEVPPAQNQDTTS